MAARTAAVVSLAAALLLTLCGLGLLAGRPLGGYSTQLILSDSMQPAFATGTVLVSRALPSDMYKVGDVVTYRSPQNGKVLITHRIKTLYINDRGIRVFQSKGDANSNGDPWIVSIGAVRGKEIAVVPYLGYLLYYVKTLPGFLVFTTLFFVAFVYHELRYIKSFCSARLRRAI